MRIKRLEMAYKLTGSGIAPREATPPYTINHALGEAGLLTDRFSGMGALEGEWAYNRPFALESVFTLDKWDSERTYLEFEWLMGRGRVCLNGEEAGAFAGGAFTLDITGCVRAGANLLRVEFDPGEARGIVGSVTLRGCWSLHVRSYALSAASGAISAAVEVSAHAAGRYVFRYAVSRGGEALGTFEFEEQLGARTARLNHTLRVGAEVGTYGTGGVFSGDGAFGGSGSGGTSDSASTSGLTGGSGLNSASDLAGANDLPAADSLPAASPLPCRVLLTVLRAGDACDERVGWVAGAARALDAPCHAVALEDGEEMAARLDMLLKAGARRFHARAGAYLPEEFLRRADEAGAEVIAPLIPPTPHACLRAGAPEPEWTRALGMRRLNPPARPIPEIALRALGMDEVLALRPDELMGGCLIGDVARLSRVMRYLQAQRVACAAEADAGVAFDLGGGWGRAASRDLFDEGKPRPAYYALCVAWREAGVYARLGGLAFEPGAQVSVPVFTRGGGFERVCAELYDCHGHVLNRAEFVCAGEGRVGELMFVASGECAACLLRLTGWREGGVCVRDYPVLTRGAHELEALIRLFPAQVKREGGEYVNKADVIAFGPVREDGGSALLPGERCALLSSEGVNVFEYAALDA